MIKIKQLKISFLDDTTIKSLSKGEVKKPETINYRTLKPEQGGLFCQKIFGPIKNYTCLCTKPNQTINTTCDICGIDRISSINRRKRIGHIKLNTHIVHIWLLKINPSKLSILLNKSTKQLEQVIYYKAYIVTHSKIPEIKIGKTIKIKLHNKYITKYGNLIKLKTGASAIKTLLKHSHLSTPVNYKHHTIKLKILKQFKKNQSHPKQLVNKYIPVLPPELRPLINMGNNKFITSDLNELYKRIISRNNRLKKLKKIAAPEFIIMNEKRLLQEAFDCLIDNGKRTKAYKTSNKILLKSLSENLKGKKGRFRQNLLGKRVDYSGRAVIVVDPKLPINKCKIPILILQELFKPHIYNYLSKHNIAKNIQHAIKKANKKPLIIKALTTILKTHPILLNRAPTLHKLNLQGFKAKITQCKTIKINPLICKAFNADFDGDQMAIHIPLTIESINEVKNTIMVEKNIFSPANNTLNIMPTQEILLGINYLTQSNNCNNTHKLKLFTSTHDVNSYYYNTNKFQETIYFKTTTNNFIKTTIGRVLLFSKMKIKELLGKYNSTINKQKLNKLIYHLKLKFKQQKLIKIINKITQLGFKIATISGTSIALSDIKTNTLTNKILHKYLKLQTNKSNFINKNSNQPIDIKLYQKLIISTNKLANKINKQQLININQNQYKIYIPTTLQNIISSGAKGTPGQMSQILNMRGLVMKSNNEIINFPILNSLKNGMSCNEFFISTFGARKGLSDTSIKTAESGYLTRKLIDVTQNLSIQAKDCKTRKPLIIKKTHNLNKHLIGKVICKNIYSKTGKLLAKRNTLITNTLIQTLKHHSIDINIRSIIFCKLQTGICSYCYGVDTDTQKLISIGSAAGIIAAQSIGEPGTQLTMRTFHTGGVLSNIHTNTKTKTINTHTYFNKPSTNLKTDNNYTLNNGKIFSLNLNSEIINSNNISVNKTIPHNNKFIYPTTHTYISTHTHLKYTLKNLKKTNIQAHINNKYIDIFLIKNSQYTQPKIVITNNTYTKSIKLTNQEIVIVPKKTHIKTNYILKIKNQNTNNNNEITDKLNTISKILENTYLLPQLHTHTLIQTRKPNLNTPALVKLKNKGTITHIYTHTTLIKALKLDIFTKYFIFKIKSLYENFGIKIHIKHFETIIKCMLQINYNKTKQITTNSITGITQLAMNSKSFISAAAFQETIRIIVNSAIVFKIDKLKGIKENVIIGSIVPIGTGLFIKPK